MCVWSVVEKRKKQIKITWAQEPVVRFRWYENKERKQKVQGDYRLCVLSPMMKNFYNQPFKCAPPVDKSRQGRILSVSGCASTAHTQHVHTLWSTVTIYLSWYIEIRCWCAASVCVARRKSNILSHLSPSASSSSTAVPTEPFCRGRRLVMMTAQAKGGRKKTIGSIQHFAHNFFCFFFFFFGSVWVGLAGGRLVVCQPAGARDR